VFASTCANFTVMEGHVLEGTCPPTLQGGLYLDDPKTSMRRLSRMLAVGRIGTSATPSSAVTVRTAVRAAQIRYRKSDVRRTRRQGILRGGKPGEQQAYHAICRG